MRTVSAFDLTYSHNRRKHAHRCRCCNRIMQDGESAVMARVSFKKTYVVHGACAEQRHSTEYTWREALTLWAKEALKS